MNEKIQTFLIELSYISSHDIRAFTEILIKNLNDRFFEEPASSTGKYHPEISNGYGGLVRHTKLVVEIAKNIVATNMLGVVDSSVIYSACILHDGWKYSDNPENKFTVKDHAVSSVQSIKSIIKDCGFFDIYNTIPSWYQEILNCIQGHNGFFAYNKSTQSYEYNGVWSNEQKIVHISDYLASRKFVISETKEITSTDLIKAFKANKLSVNDIHQMKINL